jgi:hypothetical protein
MDQTKLEQHAQEIVPGLWLGGRWACSYAHEARFRTICVLESPCVQGCFHAPILAVDSGVVLNGRETQVVKEECGGFVEAHLLKTAHLAIDEFLKIGSVLVHCLAGRERSPLVVATWLCERHGFTLDEAYEFIISKRQIVERLEISARLRKHRLAAAKALHTKRRMSALAKARAAEAASKETLRAYCQERGWKIAFFEGVAGSPRTGIIDAVADALEIRLVQFKGGKAGISGSEMARLKKASSIATVKWVIAAYDGEPMQLCRMI